MRHGNAYDFSQCQSEQRVHQVTEQITEPLLGLECALAPSPHHSVAPHIAAALQQVGHLFKQKKLWH